MNILALIFEKYFWLRQIIPIMFYVFYINFQEVDNPIIEKIVTTLLAFIGLISAYTFLGVILKIPFSNLIPFTWTYHGLIHWCIFFFFFFHIATQQNLNNLTSFTLATLATVGGGWLYEVPIFNLEHIKSIFFTRYSIFYINGQIMCLLFLGYEIMKRGFKPNRLIYVTLLLFLVFSTSLFLDPDFYRTGLKLLNIKWFYRIPASLFLLSLLSGIRKQSEMMKNV